MRALVAGNWKMHGLGGDLACLDALQAALVRESAPCDVLVCPPATLIARAVATAKGRFAIGGQDCHDQPSGAFTGDIAAPMLQDAGARFVILGHSERRHLHGESDALIAAKTRAAWDAHLVAIVCVGETERERDAGEAQAVCRSQIFASLPDGATAANTVLAYEPVWAIGSGRTASLHDIQTMHAYLRGALVARCGDAGRAMRILYGGSVQPDNAKDILALDDVGGALVGGASLDAEDFLGIIRAAPSRVRLF